MNGLNYNIFYKAKFMIENLNPEKDFLWNIVLCIRYWQTQKWNQKGVVLDDKLSSWSHLKAGGRVFSKHSNKPVYIEAESFIPKDKPEQRFWACKISETKAKARGYCERSWVTEIGVRILEPNIAEFSCVISYGDTPEFIGHYEDVPTPTLPRLISILLKNEALRCYAGVDAIDNTATLLKPGDFPEFQTALTNPERTLPYVYISPQRCDEDDNTKTLLLVNPIKLARLVCGNARVFYSDDFSFTQEMSYLFECKDYCCYNGAIRVYKPNLIDTKDCSDASRHRLLPARFIQETGEEETLRIFRRALAQNVNFYESFFGMKQCQDMRKEEERRLRLEEIRAKHAEEIDRVSDAILEEAIQEEAKRIEAEQLVYSLEQQIDDLNNLKFQLENQIDSMRSAVLRSKSLEKAAESRMHIEQYPTTPQTIAGYFSLVFADRIAFSEEGLKSLKECILPLPELWNILHKLATVMRELLSSDSCPEPEKQFTQRTGIHVGRGEGRQTRKNAALMSQFETEYDGRTIDIEAHIKPSINTQRIHFGYDDVSKKIIIGHCGEHLDIHSTKKHK